MNHSFQSIADAVAQRPSKEEAVALAQWMGPSQARFDELWACITQGEPPMPRYAAWVMDKYTEIHPTFAQPHLEEMVHMLSQNYHNAVHRAILKVIARNPIPEDLQGILFDYAMEKLLNPQSMAAIQAHSMTIAYHIAKDIPELKTELKAVIEDQMEYNSAAFKSRGKRILKQLNR